MRKLKSGFLWTVLFSALLILFSGTLFASDNQSQFMKIKVVDQQTGRGVPMVQLRTNHLSGISFFTDSQGVAAIHEPGLMGREVVFEIRSPGYLYNPSGRQSHRFAITEQLKLVPGGSKALPLRRNFFLQKDPRHSNVALSRNVAERLYRITGSGIYRDSWLLDEATPIDHPLLNAGVMIQGGALNAVFQGKLFWFFSPEGAPPDADFRRQVSGATSKLRQGLDPMVGVNLNYFKNFEGSSRSVLPTLRGETVALNSLMIPQTDLPRMYAQFRLNSKSDTFQGLARWDGAERRFRFIKEFPRDLRVKMCSNAIRVREDGREWFYFSCPFPLVRVPATPDAIKDSSRYQTFTPVAQGESWKGKDTELSDDRAWEWKRRTATLDHRREFTLRRPFFFGRNQGIHHLTDVLTGESILSHEGTVFWNEFRNQWVMITNGSAPQESREGKVFYAEADSPLGPWVYARQITTHAHAMGQRLKQPYQGKFSFRAVKQHPYFNTNQGKTIFFSGMLKNATAAHEIPRYNHNHLMYSLSLTNKRLHLPTPVYVNGDFQNFDGFSYGTARTRSDTQQRSGMILFYAYPVDRHQRPEPDPLFKQAQERFQVDPIPVWQENRQVNGGQATGLTTEKSPQVQSDTPVFYAWPSDVNFDHPNLTLLQEYKHPSKSTLLYVPEEFASFLENLGWSLEGSLGAVWSSPRLDPPTNPGAEPVQTCLGSSAVCDVN